MPSSILNSDDGVISGTSGIKAVGGDDGVLVFQSKGTETARINTDSQIVAAAGTASLPIYSTTGDTNTGIFFPAADNIGFATNGVIRGRWTTDGLCFNADTAAANALDDYEEGSWTPAFQNIGTGTYSTQIGRYTKIGDTVFAWFHLDINTQGTASGAVIITGLPFTSANINDFYGFSTSIHANAFTTARTGELNFLVLPNATTTSVLLYGMASTTTLTVTHADMGAGNLLSCLIYKT